MKPHGLTLRAYGLAAMMLCAAMPPAQAQAPKLTTEDVVRLLRIAVMAEWVSGQCGERYAAELSPMLLLTTGSMLRTADAGDVERFRAAMQQNAQTFATKDAACRSATDYLKSVQ
ncbi:MULTISPECIES: hypothetical protein [unclassified Bosea (in: a-proteobacteria)]|uniref:hypothetical protein n=1 Tax=unclassified Bosea (in: a-proteobacteria) TaxID=2653178 RepID=UPI000F751D8E|nr:MULTISPECIES: hypothetical protein [unclassified Bosea (in: a-proteobacteria)]AZO76867.1 hypothetical protein BLM15_03985 [Bosea sp. Tri-49]RXT21701.1 hypothetical protein B5U98_14605 [Bosea sp. Tri-39]RXT32041.1 hypothetical protein B5U99_25450 [Bosea sp. Tri-54]